MGKMIDLENLEELKKYLIRVDVNNTGDYYYSLGKGDDCFNVNFEIDNELFQFLTDTTKKIAFYNCTFNKVITLNKNQALRVVTDGVNSINNKNSDKSKNEKIVNSISGFSIAFNSCTFHLQPRLSEFTYEKKIRFYNCSFNSFILVNTKFKSLFELVKCEINGAVIFNKVDFEGNAVFTKTHFYSNVLFTYSTFEKLGIFSRAQFIGSGLDLSQSIINGNLTFFQTQLDNYKSEIIDSFIEKYDKAINEEGIIPNQNKRETFRIIKQQLIVQNNLIEAEKFAKFEKQAYLEEKINENPNFSLYLRKIKSNKIAKRFYELLKRKWDSNTIILIFNRLSNHYKTDYRNGVSFTFLSLIVFTSLTFVSSFEFWSRICLECDFDLDTFNYVVKQIFLNLNPVHSFDYIDDLQPIFGLPYLFDFLGRIFIGYGIYQTVQAFRKFK
ncbi:pentapeptide repeat-containing protein [Psychroflexus salis]|uniref:Pentapeptide repeat-containing protein n=1 Tax=Psychroflexus salis TaxID=1526574 RepID=A0A916ZNY0_9FLAO|nr:pentapeptide repeat-containing protein [Psychroflexus salis]GGE06940.1 hypothetical protein GCM10010831_05530 [Psychroflexus salis]